MPHVPLLTTGIFLSWIKGLRIWSAEEDESLDEDNICSTVICSVSFSVPSVESWFPWFNLCCFRLSVTFFSRGEKFDGIFVLVESLWTRGGNVLKIWECLFIEQVFFRAVLYFWGNPNSLSSPCALPRGFKVGSETTEAPTAALQSVDVILLSSLCSDLQL